MRRAAGKYVLDAGERGSSMVELVVTIGLVATLLAAAVWSLDRRYFDLERSFQQLAGDLREVRMEATLRGAHFRVVPDGDAYSVMRLRDQDGDGIWQPDPRYAERSVQLPAGLAVSAAAEDGSPTAAEFDSRGVLVDPAGGAPGVVGFVLESEGETRRIFVWPSGQLRLERGAEVAS